jgi:hypothetical protein
MTLTIDSLTGLGPIDYTAALAADAPLKITRTLNQPSILSALLELGTLPAPARRGRVLVASANGTLLFTGYLAIEPVALYAGVATAGPVYRYEISAVGDEWLLDKQPLPLYRPVLNAPAGTALRALAQRAASGLFSTSSLTSGRAVGVFEPSQSASWSANAGELAAAAYSAYRVLDGALTLQPAGSVTHAMNFDTGLVSGAGSGSGSSGTASSGVAIAALKTASVKELANDVTLSGAIEPAAYIAESFMGDGVTTVFQLSESPFRPGSAASRKLLTDPFNEASIDTQLWSITDPGAFLSLGGAGLVLNGGNGYDGQTSLAALDPIELGGSLVLEAGSVLINPASQGVLLGLYNGPIAIPNCVAGFNLRQLSGASVLTPLIDGVETGTTFNVQAGHAYTLRIRLHSPEMQRVLQSYYSMVSGAVASFGGGAIAAPVTLVFELLDQGAASNTPVTILYDGSAQTPLASTPAQCTFAAVNAAQIFGSIGYVTLTQTGSAFVTSTPPGGVTQTRLIGIAGQGVDCSLSGTGKLTFFAGRVPVAGEIITVAYRGSQRAVTRIQNATSIASEAATGVPGVSQWLGKVLKPPARSTADCEAAALAVLSFATSRAAALSGTCTAVNPHQLADIWPGDLLALTQNSAALNVIVRKVEITPAPSFPEEITYKIAFANDWAEGLGLTLSDVIAADTILPLNPQTTAQFATGANASVLANLPQLQVVSATGTALQIDAGLAPPSGGGFEVRRRDNAFGPNIAQDLVLRSPVRSFSIPREAQVERYYIRMYDASTPPLYSRLSSGVFTNLPIS